MEELSKATTASKGTIDRESTFKTKSEAFERFADLMTSTAIQVALTGASKNQAILDRLQSQADKVIVF